MSVIKSCELEEHGLALEGADMKRIVIPEAIPEALAPWYRKKQLYISKQGAQVPWAYSSDIVERVAGDFLALEPMYHVLHGAVEQLMVQEDE